MSDHICICPSYIRLCTLRTNNRLVTIQFSDWPITFTSSFFLLSYQIGDRLCCLVDGQPDDEKEQMNDLDVFGHCHYRENFKKRKEKEKLRHKSKYYTIISILSSHWLQQNQSSFFLYIFYIYIYIYIYVHMKKEKRKK